jgi:nitroreductase
MRDGNEIIRKRKSIRKYSRKPLDASVLAAVREQAETITPLNPNIRYSIGFSEKTKGIFGINAPHYLVFHSEDTPWAFENIGFIGQQMDLFFSANGIGSCWLGMAKPVDGDSGGLSFIISMAFGTPDEPLHRNLAEFKRKAIAEISEGER